VYLLDTDITSNILDTRRSSPVLRERLRLEALDELAICVVTVEDIAIARGCTVVTANIRHFSKIPGLSIEDWTQKS